MISLAIPGNVTTAWNEIVALTQTELFAYEIPIALAVLIAASTVGIHLRNNWLRQTDAIVADRRTFSAPEIDVAR